MGFSQPASNEYSLSDDFYPWFMRRMRIKMLSIAALMAVIATAVSARDVHWHSSRTSLGLKLFLLLGPTVLILGVWLIQVPILIKRQLESFRSYKIVIDGNKISKIQADHPDITLDRASIKTIEEREGYGLIVSGQSRVDRVWVPLYMGDYDSLKRDLGYLRPIDKAHGFSIGGSNGFKVLGGFALGIVIVTGIYIFTGIVGVEIFTVVSLPVGIWRAHRNPNMSKQMVRSLWLAWAVALLSLLIRFL